ncbi:phosphatidate cytidylyltransferase [Shimia sp. CNT1-13L.2]|uniref:phosphatidate cytidylyltransferase n=1 Tax=Shimia sp. CNT1-13L.2 TaxID=2959663 RepID=UPI0020CCA9E7|nr:phosphatidate cytidylyltransferase [Shimia sp. CNT1-13L.2]
MSVVQIAYAAGVLLAIGATTIAILMMVPAGRKVASDLVGAFGSLAITAAVLIGVFLAGPWALMVFFLLLAGRVTFEAAQVRLGNGYVFGSVAVLLTLGSVLHEAVAPTLIALWFLVAGRLLAVPWADNSKWRAVIEVLLFPALPVAILAQGVLRPELTALMLAIYVLIETFDSYALVVGKVFGRTKAFPVLSPRKTVEGLLGGTVCLVITAAGVASLVGEPVGLACGIAVAVGVLGLAGDLGASRLKRIGGVKDYPVVLKRQGGAFDIFDSWIAAGAGVTAGAMLWSML